MTLVCSGWPDLAESHPEKFKELLGLWKDYVEETGVIEEAIRFFDADPSHRLPEPK
jgi:hypothetical protein